MVARLSFVGAICLIAGCTTPAKRQEQLIETKGPAILAQLMDCHNSLYYSRDFDPLRSHIPGNLEQPTLEQETDIAFISDKERKAVYATNWKDVACQREALNRLLPITPTTVTILAVEYGKLQDLQVALVQRELTWGDYTVQVKALINDTRGELRAEARRMDAGLDWSHEAVLARQRAAKNAYLQYASRPVITGRSAMSDKASCLTH